MSRRIKCCENCEKWESGCHSSCKDYTIEKTVNDILEIERRKEITSRNDQYALAERRVKKQVKNGSPNASKSGIYRSK